MFWFVVLLMLAASGAAAQTTSPTTAPKVADGQTGPLTLRSERNSGNLLIVGVSLESLYDNDALSTTAGRLGDLAWNIRPRLALSQSRRRLRWTLDYSPTLAFNHRLAERDLFTHTFGLDAQYRATRRLTVHLRDSVRVETNLLDGLSQRPFVPEFGTLDRPNDSFVTPATRRIYHGAGLDLSYLLGPYTMVGLSGTFAQTRFRNLPAQPPVGTNLIDSQAQGGRAFFSRRLTRRHSIGATYQFNAFSFQQGQARAVTQSFFYTHSVELTPSMSLSFFVGPDFSRIHNQLLLILNLGSLVGQFKVNTFSTPSSLSGGATYRWEGNRTVFRASWVRRVDDGGGLFGASRLQAATGELRRQLAHRWTAGVGISYGTTSILGLSSPVAASRALSATSDVSWTVAEHLSLAFRYAHLHQGGYGTSVFNNFNDHDQFSVSLTYQFARPLGQ